MDNKDVYEPKEIVSMMRLYSELNSAYLEYVRTRVVAKEASNVRTPDVKDLALKTLQSLLKFERQVPANVRTSFDREVADIERVIQQTIDA